MRSIYSYESSDGLEVHAVGPRKLNITVKVPDDVPLEGPGSTYAVAGLLASKLGGRPGMGKALNKAAQYD